MHGAFFLLFQLLLISLLLLLCLLLDLLAFNVCGNVCYDTLSDRTHQSKKKNTNTNVFEPVIYSGFEQMLALAPVLNLGVKVL